MTWSRTEDSGDAAEPASRVEVGRVLADRYLLVRFIADGGMGSVYEARDQLLGDRVAVKMVRDDIARNPATMTRFRREIQLAHKVSHPNVCRIFDVARHALPDGSELPLLTMEYIAGETLSAKIRRDGPLAPGDAREIALQICAGLAAAHDAGVVHRDLKSQNVMIEEAGRRRAVITDFGLARAPEHEADVGVTRDGAFIGTPAYMAPEQVEGKSATKASDSYSLGVVLYELVTGALPFEGDTPLATASKRLVDDPVPPRARRPDLDATWERTLLRCLARRPEDRFTSAGDVAAALRGETRSRGRLVVAGAVAAAAITAVAIWVISRPVPPPSGPALAVLGLANLSGDEGRNWIAGKITSELDAALAGGATRILTGDEVARARRDLTVPPAGTLDREALARARQTLGATHVAIGTYLATSSGLEITLVVQETLTGETIVQASERGTERELAPLAGKVAAVVRSRLEGDRRTTTSDSVWMRVPPEDPEAARLYADAVTRHLADDPLAARALLERVVAREPDHALTHALLGTVLTSLKMDQKAKAELRRAHELAAALPRETRLYIEAMFLRRSRESMDKAVAIARELVDYAPSSAEYALFLVRTLGNAGRPAEAIVALEDLRRRVPQLGDDPAIDAAEARAAWQNGEARRAAEVAARGAARARARGAWVVFAHAKASEGTALIDLAQTADARRAFDEAARAWDRLGIVGGQIDVLWNRFHMRSSLDGDMRGALLDMLAVLQISRALGTANGPNVLANIAVMLHSLGDLAAADRFYAAAIEDGSGDLTARDWNIINRANLARQRGDLDGAGRMLDELLARNVDNKRLLSRIEAARCELFLHRGDLRGATTACASATAMARGIGHRALSLEYAITETELGLRAGDLAGAERALTAVVALSVTEPSPGTLTYVAAARASVLARRGRLAEARAVIEEAAPRALALQEPAIRLRFQTVMGDAGALREVIAEAQRLGMVPLEMDARLAVAEITRSRAELAALERDASRRGFGYVAGRARQLRSALHE